MYHLLRWRSGLAACALLALAAVPAHAQQQRPAPAVVAINTMMDFRAHWAGDSTRFDACSVYKALGRPENFAEAILASVRSLLDRTSEPCADDAARASVQRPLNYVRVDSISISGDSAARVYVTVRKQSEQRYFETYELGGLNKSPPLGWVREVKVWGMMRDYLVPPGSARPPRP